MTIASTKLSQLSAEKQRQLLAKLLEKKAQKPKLVPLSFAQQRLWFLDKLEPNNPFYNIPEAVRLTGILNIDALTQSLNKIVQRHETLRTTFALIDEEPKQVIVPTMTIPLPCQQLHLPTLPEREAEARALMIQEVQRPFDLAKGPLIRALLLQLDPQEHILFVNMHHIISDGWSLGIFVQELIILYEEFAQGKTPQLPQLPIQYADFTMWQRDWLRSDILTNQLAYWQKQLDGPLPTLNLPTDRPYPALQTYNGATCSLLLPQTLIQKLKSIGQREDATLFMVLLATFNILMCRYTGQEDILVGSPIANRQRAELESLIGFFVNTVVLRTDLSNNPTFHTLLKQVRATTLEAYAHQDVPFEKLVDVIQPERNLSRPPLFQVMFALQNTPLSLPSLPDLTLQPFELLTTTSKFDFTLYLIPTAGGLETTIEYNKDLFNASTMTRLLNHFHVLLSAIVKNPEIPIVNLPILTKLEEKQIVIEWNATDKAYDTSRFIHEKFSYQAHQTPDAIALVFGEQQLTYRVLNERANQLAHYLKKQGVGADTLVGLYAERSLEMVVGLFGILKAGGAYVPIDPTYPSERVTYMIDNAEVSVLLIQQHLADTLPQHSAHVIALDADWATIANESKENPARCITDTNLAYMIYTSGSTGRPKGAMNSHEAIRNRLLWMQDIYQLTAADHVLQKTPFSFDVSVWEFFWPLMVGARLIIAKPEGHKDSDYLVDLISKEHITFMHFVPSMLQSFVEAAHLETCHTLRQVICSGEALPFDLQERFFARLPHADLHNLYGPTEAAIDVTYWVCQHHSQHTIVPIGQPLANCQVYVLDSLMQPVPIGVAGELYLGGIHLARGYHRRPALTAEKFVPNPFQQQTRLYRTGDLVRYLDDGNIEFLGRVDFQVKVRGFRIELGEIEAILTEHAPIREAVVMARTNHLGDTYLAAYITFHEGQTSTTPTMQQFLRQSLPNYMIPSIFTVLETFPLTSSGKVNRRALPEPDTTQRRADTTYLPPRTPTETLLATIWANGLGIEQVSIYDNFFDLGGNSIRSIQILAKIKEAGLDISLQQLFQYQTIESLSRIIDQTDETATVRTLHTVPYQLIIASDRAQLPEKVEDAYPLTKLQAGMLFHAMANPESAVYQNIASFHLQAPLHREPLQEAIHELIAVHPLLRTSFALAGFSEPLQLVHQSVRTSIQWHDIMHLSDAEQDFTFTTWFEAEKYHFFDYTKPSLLRFNIHKRSTTSFNFTITFHHAILDGWSVGSLLRELFQRYLHRLQMDVPLLPPPPVSTFRDFVALERITQAEAESQQYWAGKLANATITPLPRWSDTSASDNVGKLGSHQLVFANEVYAGLKRLKQQANVPIKSILLAAHLRVVSLLAGQSDVITGFAINGRLETADGERVLGIFINTLPLRMQLTGGTWLELVKNTFQAEQELLPFRRYPLAEIQQTHGNGQPLFETAFNYNHFYIYDGILQYEGIDVVDKLFYGRTNFVLGANFHMNLSHDQIELSLDYDADQLSVDQIKAIAGYYNRAIIALATAPATRYETYSLLTTTELETLLSQWHKQPVTYPQTACLHQLFVQQVVQVPEQTAVVFEDISLTYKTLNEQANQLAHHLQARGVGPNVLVGIYMERSADVIIAILAILKAGGAYLPLDPVYPAARLHFMITDANIPILLTQSALSSNVLIDDVEVIAIDDAWPTIRQNPTNNPETAVQPHHLAYVIYTSGSTGKPKGVLITHENVTRLFVATDAWYQFNNKDVWTMFHSYAFDFSVWEIWGALLHGGRLVIVPYWISRTPTAFYALLKRERVTILNQTPSAFRQLIHAETETTVDNAALNLRFIIFGGEALDLPSLRPWFERHGDKTPQLVNMYGITETTIHVTYWPIRLADLNSKRSMIGLPIPDLQLYLLDHQQQPVPIGVTGEMYVGGAGVAQGYLNRPALTEARFIPNPFDKQQKTRLYRTGDLARYHPNGNLEYLGRIDHQVKIRGFRIELGEIEAALTQQPIIREALAQTHHDEQGNIDLVAYVVPQTSPLDIADLRHALHQLLPDYMVPTLFILLDRFPLTPNGKIDRRALPAPDKQHQLTETTYVAPRTPIEQQLANIWAEGLDVTRVGIHDNFLALGGNSIRSIQILTQARANGINFSLQQLFQHQTIAALSNALQTTDVAALPIPTTKPFSLIADTDRAELPDGIEDAYPLTRLQAGMIFHTIANPETAVYHDIFSFHLRMPLQVNLFEAAIHQLLAHHPILRTSFALNGFSQALQLVHQTVPAHIKWVDLTQLSAVEQEETIQAWIETEKQNHFDYQTPSLLRFWIHQRNHDTFNLSWSCHHAILDGWSVALLLTELFQRYLHLLGQDVPLLSPAPTSTFRDFVALEIATQNWDAAKQYWHHTLKDTTITKVPRLPQAFRQAKTNQLGLHFVHISSELAQKLESLAQQASVPLKTILLAAHVRVLSFISGQMNVTTGLVANGRLEERDGERVLGLFLNTLPLHMHLNGGSWIDLIQHTFATEQASLPYRRYPLADMQHTFGHGYPLFETSFNFIRFHVLEDVIASGTVEILNDQLFERTNFIFDANFQQQLASSEIELTLSYDAGELSATQVSDIANYYKRALSQMVIQPYEQYELTSLLSSASWEKLVTPSTTVSAPLSIGHTIHQLFEAQAAQTPTATAVVSAGNQLTYAELNMRANQLAHYLQAMRVGPETVVAIALEQSLDLAVGLLGILKSGAAYLPLDLSLPSERLQFMITDAQVSILLTQMYLMDTKALPTANYKPIYLDSMWKDIAQESTQIPQNLVTPSNLAYIIYTSGSTGQPKGVLVTHDNLCHHTQAIIPEYQLTKNDRALQFANLSFDVAAEEIFATWLSGAALVFSPIKRFASFYDFTEFVSANAITVLNLPAPFWHEWVHSLSQRETAVPNTVRLVVVGSEKVLPPRLQDWQQLGLTTVQWCNAYGPTEATITATLHHLQQIPLNLDLIDTVPIGHPVQDTPLYILDPYLQPVPIGTAGELYIGGARVARGYHHHPQRTASHFIPDPFAEIAGRRLYRTGDLTRYLPDGTIEFLGRIDSQVKIRGFRIELGEIEAALSQHQMIREAVVTVKSSQLQESRLVAYVVPQQIEALPNNLPSFLAQQLPAYMIPTSFVYLETLPLSSNGKINRRALPEPKHQPARLYKAPRDTLEKQLTEIWSTVLSIDKLSVDDNFFELGGHSLLVMRIIALIQNKLGKQISVATLFRHATIEQLATALRQQTVTISPNLLVPLHLSNIEQPPLFFIHPVAGTIFDYTQLAALLGTERPCYGLQSQGLDGLHLPYTTIEAMATAYVAAIQTIQSVGPYTLIGWSMGGVIAIEMGRQLQTKGYDIKLVILLDTQVPQAQQSHANDDTALLLDFAQAMGVTIASTSLDHLSFAEQQTYLWQQAKQTQCIPPETSLTQIQNAFTVFSNNVRATQQYEPPLLTFPTVLFKAQDPDTHAATYAWTTTHSDYLRVENASGTHETMVDAPHVTMLAQQIQSYLDED